MKAYGSNKKYVSRFYSHRRRKLVVKNAYRRFKKRARRDKREEIGELET